MDRRTLLQQTGSVAAGVALATHLPASVGAAAAAQDASTLTFWDTLNSEPRSTMIEDLAASFGEANGVEVEHRGWTLDELQDTLPRAVESNEGPAVAQVNNGENLAGPMIRAGQLVDLTPYIAEYGWDTTLPESLAARCSFNADGTVFGEGQLWGIPSESEIVGFYYNKTIFEENGLSVPTTFAELETLLGALVDAGVPPIAFGNSEAWPAIHLYGSIHATMTNREELDAIVYRREGATFDHPSFTDAATKLVEWVDAGYLIEGYEGLTADDAAALFTTGEGGLLLQGSWQAPMVKEEMGDVAGFFLMPPVEAGGSVLHVGGVGIPYSITTNAPDPAIAAAFIDSLLSQEAFDKWIEAGGLPAGEIADDKIVADTVDGDLYTAWNSALAADSLGHYLDWAAPGFYDELTGQLQNLLGGQVEPADFVTALETFYAASFTS
jgi:raffinose/stachyose/melibiose transport system substrate-binding protein